MVRNLKCDECVFSGKCVARNKLKPFLEDARTDLGVMLDFISCVDFMTEEEKNETEESEDED